MVFVTSFWYYYLLTSEQATYKKTGNTLVAVKIYNEGFEKVVEEEAEILETLKRYKFLTYKKLDFPLEKIYPEWLIC